MSRDPPALGADDNPPSPLPPPTPYTEPPTPMTPQPDSPRLRPLRRLAARKDPPAERPPRRSRRLADADPHLPQLPDQHPPQPQPQPQPQPLPTSPPSPRSSPDRPLTRASANRPTSPPPSHPDAAPTQPPPPPPPPPQSPDHPSAAAAHSHNSPHNPLESPAPPPQTHPTPASAAQPASDPPPAPDRLPSPAEPPSDLPSSDAPQPLETAPPSDHPMPDAPPQPSDQIQPHLTQPHQPDQQSPNPVHPPSTPPPAVDKIHLVQSQQNVPGTQPDQTPSTPPQPSPVADVMQIHSSSPRPAAHPEPPTDSPKPPEPPEPAPKPSRPRQLAVRAHLARPERRQLAVRTLAITPPSPPPSPPPAHPKPHPQTPNTAPPPSRRKSTSTSRSSSPHIVAVHTTSRYSTRSATKDTHLPPRRTRSRRQSEPVPSALSERTQRRKGQRRPVKGDRLRVLWHIDLVYYQGVVDSVLSYRGNKFYDVTYDSGEREYYLDLTTRKWTFVDDAHVHESHDTIPEPPPPQPDYSNFPNIDDKVLVMWHVDGKYYPGVVQDILKTSTGWFYDVGYQGGDREFFLDLNVRKWKYASEHLRKSAPRQPPREKAKRVARKSTMGSASYLPPPSSQPPPVPSTSDVDSADQQQSRALRVESLLEVKERQEQQRRALEQQKQNNHEQLTKMAEKSVEKQPQVRAPKTLQARKDTTIMEKPAATRKPESDVVASTVLSPSGVSPVVTAPLKHVPPHLESPFDIDLPELNEDAFENVMADIDAPLSLGSTKKRLRPPAQTPETEAQPKRLREPDSLGVTPTVSLLEDEPQSSDPSAARRQPQDLGEDPLPYSAHDRRLASIHSVPFSSPKPASPQRRALASMPSSASQLPPNAAPPARKTVQQRSRPEVTRKRKSQQLLQSEPNFIPRPRPSSRARSLSRRPTSRRRASSPYHRADRKKLRSRASSPDYSFMRPSPYPSSRAIESRRRTKTTVADIVSVSGHAAKKWLDENTKQFSANLKRMDAELAKMKVTHQKLTKAKKAPSKHTVKRITPRSEEPDISDGERESVLHSMMNDFLRRVQKYKATVEEREQSLLRQFAGFKKTLLSQNGKLVVAGKVLAKLDIQGVEALENLQPVVRKKLEIPPPVPARRPLGMNGTTSYDSSPVRFGQPPADDHRATPTGRRRAQREVQVQEKHSVPDQRSEAVVKTLRLKLADLVTRSDWLGEEVTRLKQREKALLKEKREALTELTKIRSEGSSAKGDTVSARPRVLPSRSAMPRPVQRAPPNSATAKPLGIVKKATVADNRGGGLAPRKNLSTANLKYKPRTSIAPAPLGLELRSRTPKVPPPPVLTAAKPTPMEDVTRPKDSERPESEKARPDIERGASFTDDLGKSMDKQASELLALIFTIWLLQDESRSEPPKQPGDRMDSWVRGCVRNCLKHARTYLDVTSGITTARRSLMHDVDGENIYTEWILGDSDSTFEQARSNYSLWDPTLQDVEWLAEKRVLVGLSICYRKAWKETSARQYETTLMYAKAIAHRAVSNFELYMPPTVVLGGPAISHPVPAKPTPQAVVPTGSTNKATPQTTAQVTPAAGSVSVPRATMQNVDPQKPVPVSTIPLTSRAVTKQPPIVTPKGSIVTQPASSGTPASLRQEVLPPVSSTVMKTGLAAANIPTPKASTTPETGSALNAHAPGKADVPKPVGTGGHAAEGIAPAASPSPTNSTHPTLAHPSSQRQNEGATGRSSEERPEALQQQHQGETVIPSPTRPQLRESQKLEKSGGESSSILGQGTTPKPPPAKETAPSRITASGNRVASDRQGSTTPLLSSSKEGTASQGQSAPVDRSPQEGKKKGPASTSEAGASAVQANQSSTTPKPLPVTQAASERKEGQVAQGQHQSIARAAATKKVSNTASLSSPPKGPQHLSSMATGSSSIPSSTFSSVPDSTANQAISLHQTRQIGSSLPHDVQGSQNESTLPAMLEKATENAVRGVQTGVAGIRNLRVSDKTGREAQTRTQGPEPGSGTADGKPRETPRSLRSSRSSVPGDVSELPSLPNLSAPRSTSWTGKRGPKASISKSLGAKGKKHSKSTKGKSSGTGKSKATRASARVAEATGTTGSPRIAHGKEVTDQDGASTVASSGMVGLMRLPGAPPTTQHAVSRSFPTFSNPVAPLTTRQPVGMKKLPLPGAPKSIPSMPQRRAAPGADPLDFDSLPSPIPRRQASKGVSDDVFSPSPQYGMEQQQGNAFTGTARWGAQPPVPRKGYKSLAMMPSSTHQGSNVVIHGSNPFESRAVAPFEYNRPGDQGLAPEQRPELMQEGNYHVVEQVDVMNPPTPASLSALEYGVEQVQREPLPNTTSEFQERFDRGYDPYRSQIGHIMNPTGKDGPDAGRNIHAKDYARR
ncbi:hypothetical protein BWQ96_04426 [Gracilariopsis chorda]|uniref:Uncharacterized protein n=1 Tax=Gracilariopsis chorda TaxID=448386 RepID=A0A2V3IUL9_9FLOR|nr:hypothetical protein BWQ96_04426 [Gracilariopsis chorda]|eukprot:PXF45814.1 hypothetical protein BWQ96_04426 [Gracilariopsis chorda]